MAFRSFFAVLLLLCAAVTGGAQTLRSSVISGGATRASGSGVQVRATLGQPLIGVAVAGTRAGFGFWFTTGSVIPSTAVHDVGSRADAFTLGMPAPNPSVGARTSLPVTLASRGTLAVAVYDASGREVDAQPSTERQPGSSMIDIDTRTLRNGAYYVRVSLDGVAKTVPFLVLR